LKDSLKTDGFKRVFKQEEDAVRRKKQVLLKKNKKKTGCTQ